MFTFPTVHLHSGIATKALSFSSYNDTNGLFYWYGTNKNTSGWTNPATAGRFTGSVLGAGAITGSFDMLFDRVTTVQNVYRNWDSANSEYAGFQVILPLKFKLTRLAFKSLNGSAAFPSDWLLKARNDTGVYTTINTYYTPGSPAANTWYLFDINCPDFYNTYNWYTTLNTNGDKYFRAAEFEFYGTTYLS